MIVLIGIFVVVALCMMITGGRARERDRLLREHNRLLQESLPAATVRDPLDVLDEVARMHGIKPRERHNWKAGSSQRR